jgi:hypothetical protein
MQNKKVKDEMAEIEIFQENLMEYSGNTSTKFVEGKRKDGEDMSIDDIREIYEYLKEKHNTNEIMIIGQSHRWLTLKTYEGDFEDNIGEKYAQQASQQKLDQSIFSNFKTVKIGLKIFDTKLYKKDKKKYYEKLDKMNE